MVKLDDITYSQDECVAAVRDYYTFLTKMYLPESCILEPLQGGWPNITIERMKDLDKTDEVVLLLRHLPYMREFSNGDPPQGAPWCMFANWKACVENVNEGADYMAGLRTCSEGTEDHESINAHVVGLTMGGRDNPVFLLDTQLGIVLWQECPYEISSQDAVVEVEDDPYDYAAENEADWRSACNTWTIPDFFEVLKDQFRKLNYIPMGWDEVKDVYATMGSDTEGMLAMLQDIYREHGWPDMERYRKQECLQAVHAALKKRYPGNERDENENALVSLRG
jgi:hypothetical protein